MSASDPTQYATSANLARRADLHAAYANIGWFGWLAARMPFPPKAEVVDIGCGPGWVWRSGAVRVPGLWLTMVDRSPGMVEEAVGALADDASLGGVTGVVADAADLPLSDGAFDAAVVMHMLYHTPNPAAVLAEAARVLRPGGSVFVTVNSHDDLQEITDIILDLFGQEPMDFAATRVPLDEAERLVAAQFQDVERHDLTDAYACTDPEVVRAFIASMPPAKGAGAEAHARLGAAIHKAFDEAGGTLTAQKHTGLIVGTKPARPNA